MIQQLSWSLAGFFASRNVIPEEDSDIYAFGFECMISTAWQMFLLIVLGLVLDCFIPLMLYCAGFIFIKGKIGGYHATTHLRCTGGFTAIAIGLTFLCMQLPPWISLGFTAAACLLIIWKAPIAHYNNPKTQEEIQEARKAALLAAALEACILLCLLISPLKRFAVYGSCGLFMAALSLLIKSRGGDTDEKQQSNESGCGYGETVRD